MGRGVGWCGGVLVLGCGGVAIVLNPTEIKWLLVGGVAILLIIIPVRLLIAQGCGNDPWLVV